MRVVRRLLALAPLVAAGACGLSGVDMVLFPQGKEKFTYTQDGSLAVTVNVTGTGDTAIVRVLVGGTNSPGSTKCAVGKACQFFFFRAAGAYYVEIQLLDPPGISCMAIDGPGRLAHIAGTGSHGVDPNAENTGSMTFTVQCTAQPGG